MIKLKDSQIAQILPDVLAEQSEVKALSYAINKAIQRLLEYCGHISVFAMIDTATDEVLDLLAVELNTQYYDTSLPIENKRELIKGTMVWYMTAGTASAVEELVSATFGEGVVSEWYEYGDDPYYFKIATNAQITPDIVDKFTSIIQRVKNERSRIRGIDANRHIDQHEYVGVGAISAPRETITNNHNEEYPVASSEYAATAVRASPIVPIVNGKATKATLSDTVRIATAVKSAPHIRIGNGSQP